jgi:ABC-2 type transport system ATP-binding protein
MTRFGLEAVSVRFGETTALDRVSFVVSPGELVVVIGGDGAGKTTLCRVLAGLAKADNGRVHRPDGYRIGHLPPSSGVWPDLTVEENLTFVGRAYRLGRDEVKSRIRSLLDSTALADVRDRLAGHLSGGMRQKLGVAMALLPQPLLLVLDEPTTGIDPVSRFDMWRLISRTAAQGTALVMTTTYLDEAERASAVLALDDGHTLAWGTLEQVKASLPGRIFSTSFPMDWQYRWRRGTTWRLWSASGEAPPGARLVDHDLSDVLTAVALSRESEEAK